MKFDESTFARIAVSTNGADNSHRFGGVILD
jgi:hypothetical protein